MKVAVAAVDVLKKELPPPNEPRTEAPFLMYAALWAVADPAKLISP